MNAMVSLRLESVSVDFPVYNTSARGRSRTGCCITGRGGASPAAPATGCCVRALDKVSLSGLRTATGSA